MTVSYREVHSFYEARRKNTTHRTMKRDVRVSMQGDNLLLDFITMKYEHDKVNNKWIRVPHLTPMAMLSPDNILTLTAPVEKVNQTMAKRFTFLLGTYVNSDATNYRNYKTRLRIRADYIGYRATIPYHQGQQWSLRPNLRCLNPEPDIKIAINKSVAKDTKDKTATIRKLVKTMARVGAFDSLIGSFIEDRHKFSYGQYKTKLENINLADPSAEDAEALFTFGLLSMNRISTHFWASGAGGYTKRDINEVLAEYRDRAAERGMQVLRKFLYGAQESYIEKVVEQQPVAV